MGERGAGRPAGACVTQAPSSPIAGSLAAHGTVSYYFVLGLKSIQYSIRTKFAECRIVLWSKKRPTGLGALAILLASPSEHPPWLVVPFREPEGRKPWPHCAPSLATSRICVPGPFLTGEVIQGQDTGQAAEGTNDGFTHPQDGGGGGGGRVPLRALVVHVFIFSRHLVRSKSQHEAQQQRGRAPPNSYAAPLSDLLWCWWSPPLSRFRRRAATLRVPVCLFFFPLPCPARLILVVLQRAGRQTPIPSRTSERNVAPAPWPLTPCQSLDSSKASLPPPRRSVRQEETTHVRLVPTTIMDHGPAHGGRGLALRRHGQGHARRSVTCVPCLSLLRASSRCWWRRWLAALAVVL